MSDAHLARACSSRFREKICDPAASAPAKYPLVLKENAEYGFRRNMFAVVTLCVLPPAAAYPWDAGPQFENDHVAAIVIAGVTVLAWLFFVTKEWVRDGPHAYERALLTACEA